MDKEFELIAHPQIHAFSAILVRLFSRAPHAHREMEIGLVLDGNVEFTVNGNTNLLHSGDMYLLNPMDLHEIRGLDGSALILAIQMSRQLVTSYFSTMKIHVFWRTVCAPSSPGMRHATKL